MALYLSQWPAAAAWAAVSVAAPGSLRRIAVFPILWVAAEHGRAVAYRGFPWNLTAHALYRHPVWLQTASLWGVYGVGAAVVGASCLLGAGVVRRRATPIVFAAGIALVVGAFGVVRLSRPSPREPEASAPFSVALLQPNVSQEARLGGSAAETYAAVLAQAREAAAARPALIVVPESAFPVYWDRSAVLRRDLGEIARGSLVLFNDVEELPDGRYYNAARLLGPEGLIGRPYRKVHLVPFGEYMPLAEAALLRAPGLDGDRRVLGGGRTRRRSAGPRIRSASGSATRSCIPTSPCGRCSLGARLLVTISNDSWYGQGGAQEQHFAGAVLRSVETERYLLRAAITGISGIVDERGRILAELPRDRAGILFGRARYLERANRLDPMGTCAAVGGRRHFGRRVSLRRRSLEARASGRRPSARRGRSAGGFEMTERDDLISALQGASERLAALRGYL